MADLTSTDIELGRNALSQGLLTRPQLDAGVAMVRSGQAPDLGRALIMAGSLQTSQVDLLRPNIGSEAETLHDVHPSGPYGSAPGAMGSGPYGSAPGNMASGPYGSAPGNMGSGPYGSAPGNMGSGPYGGGNGHGPGGTTPLGSGPYGAAGSGYGPGGTTPLGSGPYGSAGPGASGPYGTAGPGASGPYGSAPANAYGPGGTSPYGTGPSGSAYGTPAGSGYGAPGGSGYGPGGTSPYGTGPGGTSPYGTGPGGTSPYGTGPGGTSPYGTGPGSGYGTGSGFFGGSDAIGQTIGDWVVRREIARGGMAVVYEAAKEDTGERSAVKVLMPSDGEVTEKKLRRFMREIDANKRLDHPNIARINDSGVVNGYPFFSMEYVEGKSLDRLLKDDLDLEIGMEVLEKIAQAIHYAHGQGIIHRDLKPANILVDDTGEELEPKVTDFGLAKTVDEASSLTRTGAVIGTPYYLSPEQAQGHSDEIDSRSDIYALGVIMYELATGRLPFVGQTTVELYNRIVNDDPVPPTKFKPQLTRALETVCLKAMAKDPLDRYESADQFAADVRALLAGEPISVKVPGKVALAIKAARKKASLGSVLIATSIVLVLVVGGVTALFLKGSKEDNTAMIQTELTSLEQRLLTALGKCDAMLDESEAFLRQGRIPNSVKSAKDARAALRKVEGGLKSDVTFEENREPALALLEQYLGERNRIAARSLVLLAKGTMRLDEGDPINDAQGMLEEALDIKADDLAAITAQGDLDALSGELEDAVTSYDEALAIDQDFVPALYGKAQASFLLEDFAQVLPLAGQALKLLEAHEQPTDAQQHMISELQLLRAQTYREQGALDKGLKEVREVLAARPTWWRAKACEGTLLAGQGLHFEARDALTAAIGMAGEGAERAGPLVMRAEVLLSLGMSAEALRDATEATEFDPGSLEAVVVRAEAAVYQLRFDDALDDANAVLVRARDRHWRVAGRAARIQARLEAIEGRVQEAYDYARNAAEHDAYSSDGRLLLARLQLDPTFEDQFLEDALGLFKAVLQQRPDSLAATRGLGLIKQVRNASDPQSAGSKLAEALKLDPNDPWALSALARVYKDLGEDSRAEGNTIKAARYERDVRRAQGYAFALGLRQEKLARRATGKAHADHLREASRGYRWAAWLNPQHTQALTGLASLAFELEDYPLAGNRLERALAADPNSTAAIMLNARFYSAQDVLIEQPRKAVNAVSEAIKKTAETPELTCLLEQLKTYQALGGTPNPEEADLPEQLKRAKAAFEALRAANPYDTASYRAERDLVSAVSKQKEELKEAADKRYRQLKDAEGELEEIKAARSAKADSLLEQARTLLDQEKLQEAFSAANSATRQAPWRAEVWSEAAALRARAGDAWTAVAAGIRAAYLDDYYVPQLFNLLRVAGRSSHEGDVERMIKLDGIKPFPADLETLIRSAPIVARSLVDSVETEQAKEVKAELEAVIEQDPTQLTPHVLLGMLAYGGGNEELAIQHLLFVATVNDHAGEAFYLSAVASVRRDGAGHTDLVHAIEWLQRASAAQFDWTSLAKDEPRLQKLKTSPLWQRLPEAKQAE